MRSQFADLGVEFFDLLLVRLLVRLGLVLTGKQSRQSAQSSGFPGADLVGMHLLLGGELGDSLFFAQRGQNDLGLEFGGIAFSSWHLESNVFAPVFVSKFLEPL